MTTVHNDIVENKKIAYTKGAFDMLLQRCTKILDLNKERDITEEDICNVINNCLELMKKPKMNCAL